ncbi:hypothetical protein CIK98_06975 [Prevotella sp. P2-180]|nr:hypothetical protein CIK98_06975 [Prevotella sp. P2-180]
MANYIRFDWAMKRMLCDKANHAVLEGLMTTLLGEKFTIVKFLESEGNQTDEEDKFNRVDILAESDRSELIIFEIQNNRELSYFHRMLYGVSKVITDYTSRNHHCCHWPFCRGDRIALANIAITYLDK